MSSNHSCGSHCMVAIQPRFEPFSALSRSSSAMKNTPLSRSSRPRRWPSMGL
ncbi:hypothetical protein ACFPRL_30420 [Pseudoclavibacter helvolus]